MKLRSQDRLSGPALSARDAGLVCIANTMPTYLENRNWSERYTPKCRQIIGANIIGVGSYRMDCEQATDLFCIGCDDLRVACRIRRPGYCKQYGNDFTIRSRLDNGYPTEIDKLRAGWAKYMLYGHAKENTVGNDSLARWMLIDLDVWRWAIASPDSRVLGGETNNGDGTWFTWYDVTTFPKTRPIVIADSGTPQRTFCFGR